MPVGEAKAIFLLPDYGHWQTPTYLRLLARHIGVDGENAADLGQPLQEDEATGPS